MPPRVTSSDVQAILPDSELTGAALDPFIAAAHLGVDRQLLNRGLSSDELFEIERWWTAHLACIADPRLTQMRLESLTEVYESPVVGCGLHGTRYGQQALLLDWTGTLAQSGRASASFRVF